MAGVVQIIHLMMELPENATQLPTQMRKVLVVPHKAGVEIVMLTAKVLGVLTSTLSPQEMVSKPRAWAWPV